MAAADDFERLDRVAGGVEWLLADFAPEVAALAQRLRTRFREQVPGIEERVYRGWRALGYHAPGAGYVCAIFPRDDRIDVAFEHGVDLEDREGLLYGAGKRVRYAPLHPTDPRLSARIEAVLALLDAAVALGARGSFQ